MRQQGQGEASQLTLTPPRAVADVPEYASRQGSFPYAAGSYRPPSQPQGPGPHRAAGNVRPPGPRPAGAPQPSVSIVLSPRPSAASQLAAPPPPQHPGMVSAPTITLSGVYQGQLRPEAGGVRPQHAPMAAASRGLPTLPQRSGVPAWAGRVGPGPQLRPAGGAASTAARPLTNLAPAGPPGSQFASQQPLQHGTSPAGPASQHPSLPGNSDPLHLSVGIGHDKGLSTPPISMQQQQAAGMPNVAVKNEQE